LISSPLTISKAISPRSKIWIPGKSGFPRARQHARESLQTSPDRSPTPEFLSPACGLRKRRRGEGTWLHHFFFAGAAFFALDAFGAAAFFAIAERAVKVRRGEG